jgi:hypothetical protein
MMKWNSMRRPPHPPPQDCLMHWKWSLYDIMAHVHIQPEQNLREHFVISEHKYIRSTSTLQTYRTRYCCLIHHWFIHQFDVPIYYMSRPYIICIMPN